MPAAATAPTVDGGTEIVSSFEVVGYETGNTAARSVDWRAVRRKKERLAEVFAELVVVGWYGVGRTREDAVQCSSSIMHVPLLEVFDDVPNGVMLALMVDRAPPASLATVPVHLFEATTSRDGVRHTAEEEQRGREAIQRHCSHNYNPEMSPCTAAHGSRIFCHNEGAPHTTVCLRNVRFLTGSDDMAQIGIDAAMSTIGPGNRSGGHEGGTVSSHPQRVKRSLLLLKRRVVLVLEHLRAIESGCVACPAPDVLRHIAKACAMLPVSTHDASLCPVAAAIIPTTAADEEVCGALAITLLSLETKCALALCELVRAQRKVRRWEGSPAARSLQNLA
ncbi:hypothetical protein TcYC6_0063350 [Trypanosoma cruzi]|nr:hypothetical protein TcYC6_0063350 [Trypanosoma cruzi]